MQSDGITTELSNVVNIKQNREFKEARNVDCNSTLWMQWNSSAMLLHVKIKSEQCNFSIFSSIPLGKVH